MANPPQYNQYSQQPRNMAPLQTQHPVQGQYPYSPQYQQSPGAMSPTAGGIPPAKRQRLSPQPGSPYNSPFSASPYQTPTTYTTPYATSPTTSQYLHPQSPSAMQPPQSFNQPQPYPHPHPQQNVQDPLARQHSQGSMPPPKVPFSKMQDTGELEKANAKDLDVNNISDVLTGSGIDLRAEEEAMFNTAGGRGYGASFNSQGTGATPSPHASFDQWGQQSSHGAYQGSGTVSQPVTQEQLEQELLQKHARAARAANEAATQHLTDPFLRAGVIRTRIAKRAYEHGITVNLDGLFDKIPEHAPPNVSGTSMSGANGEAIVGLQATSLLSQNAPLVELLTYISLAAQERVRTVVEDAFALAEGRRNTADGTVHPNLQDIAIADGAMTAKKVKTPNISKTPWEVAPDSAVSPTTVTAQKQPLNPARLPTPPSEPRWSPQTFESTVQNSSNSVAQALKRKHDQDQRFEEARVNKRKKRLDGAANTADAPSIAPPPPPEKLSKKERDRINKGNQSEESLHRKANETASMALGFGKKKNKYSWMTGGPPSAVPAPRVTTTFATTGQSSSAQPPKDKNLLARTRTFYGGKLEERPEAYKVQLRDLLHVLENDGRERKTMAKLLSQMRSTERDEQAPAVAPGAAR